MKRLIPLAAAALVAAALLFRPTPAPGGAAPAATATGWSTAVPAAIGSFTVPSAEPRAKRTVAPSAVVYVAGAVRRPGVYTVPASARVGDALARAGGGRPDADLMAVNLAARLHDGDEIAVPVLGADAPPRRPANAGGQGAHRKRGARSNGAPGNAGSRSGRGRGHRAHRADAPPPDSVDLNSADASALETLPGVGSALAERIVLFREANGPFGSVDELLDVSGITERRLELISPYVEVR
jgi:competence protein ComEA